MSATGARGAEHLHRLVQNGLARFPATALRRPDFIIPPHWGSTLMEPAQSIYKLVERLADNEHPVGLALAFGFPYSDVYEAGPAMVAYGFDQQRVDRTIDTLLNEINHCEATFSGRLYQVDEAVQEAIRLSSDAKGPIILADTQDNPGGGGPGDTVSILRALVEFEAANTVVGVIIDAQFVAEAHTAGPGAMIKASLGEKSGLPGHTPCVGKFHILKLADAPFRATGPMMAGADIDLGATALVEIRGVQVVVGSNAIQTLDQSMFRHLGVNPAQKQIIALKSSVHFRNDFQDIASEILMVAAPGPVPADLRTLSFQHLRPGLRY
jgi:microcystin degradation protein MlrC